MGITKEADAVVELQSLTAASCWPELSNADLARILKTYRRCRTWAAGEAHEGMYVVPTRGNGRMYYCLQGGQTGEDEPAFPRRGSKGATVTDNEVVWQDSYPSPADYWDMDGAASAAWLEKAARCAHKFGTKYGDETENWEQVHAHCLSMAASFRSALVF